LNLIYCYNTLKTKMRKLFTQVCAIVALILCGTTVNAMTPLSAEKLAKFDVQLDYNANGDWWHSASVSITYANSAKTQIKITGFYGRGDSRSVTADVDWETGTLTFNPCVIDNMTVGFLNYNYYFAPAAAAEATGKLISKYTSKTLTGTISEDEITIDDPWAITRVNLLGFITGYALKTDCALTTKFVKSNATQTQLESQDGYTWDNASYRVYITEDFSKQATSKVVETSVYCVNGCNNCITMQLSRNGLTSDSLYNKITVEPGSRVYGYIVDEKTVYYYDEYPTNGDFDGIVSGAITGKAAGKTLKWDSDWVVYNDTYSTDQQIYGRYKNTVFTIDGADTYVTGVNTADVSSKTVEAVKYYNVAGIASTEPFEGLNIVVTRYTDGTTSTAKRMLHQ
jgi:hypothetical protein